MPWPLYLDTEKMAMQENAQAIGKFCLQKFRTMITTQQITVATNKEIRRKSASKSGGVKKVAQKRESCSGQSGAGWTEGIC